MCVRITIARVAAVVLLAAALAPSLRVVAQEGSSQVPAYSELATGGMGTAAAPVIEAAAREGGGQVPATPGLMGTGQAAGAGAPDPTDTREAQRSAREAEQAYSAAQEAYRAGRTDMESVFRWSSRWMEEQVAAAPPLARRQAAESHLARMLALQEAVMARRAAGASISKLDEAAVRYYVAEARRQVATIVRVAPPVGATMGASPSIREEAKPKEAVPPAGGGMPSPAPGTPVREPSSSGGDVFLPGIPSSGLGPPPAASSGGEVFFTRPPGQPLDSTAASPAKTPHRTIVFQIRAASVEDVVSQIRQKYCPISVAADLRTNSVVITGTEEMIKVVEKLARTIDASAPRPGAPTGRVTETDSRPLDYDRLPMQELETAIAKCQQELTLAEERYRAAHATYQQAFNAYKAASRDEKVAALLLKLRAQAAEQRESLAVAKVQSRFQAACDAYMRRLRPE